MKAELETPSARRRDSYLSLIDEFRQRREPLVPFVLEFPTDDFPAFLAQLRQCADGIGLPEGYVPHETFWLVDEAGAVVGVSNLRTRLNDSLRRLGGHIGYGVRPSARRQGYATLILRETLAKARERGIARALITAGKDNASSIGAILRNGGVFDSEELVPGHSEPLRRYWIPLV